jgi:hypothetical protein
MNLTAVRGNSLKYFYFDQTMILKIVALIRLIGKNLYPVAAHILGLRHPPIGLSDTLFL